MLTCRRAFGPVLPRALAIGRFLPTDAFFFAKASCPNGEGARLTAPAKVDKSARHAGILRITQTARAMLRDAAQALGGNARLAVNAAS